MARRAEALSSAGRSRHRLIAIGAAALVVGFVLVVVVVSLRASRRVIDPQGTVYDNVSAEPYSVACGLSDRSMSIHTVDVGGVRWFEDPFDRRLTAGKTYRGQFRIVAVADPSLQTFRGSDKAEFHADEDQRAMFGPFPPSCE